MVVNALKTNKIRLSGQRAIRIFMGRQRRLSEKNTFGELVKYVCKPGDAWRISKLG